MSHLAHRFIPLAMLLVALGISSCTKKEKKITITGEASWKGEAIPDGDILIYPEDNSTNPDPGKIVNGRYKVETTPGKKTVQVFWAKEKPVPIGVMGQKEREQMIPVEYNSATTLTVEVVEGGKNEFHFHLPLKK